MADEFSFRYFIEQKSKGIELKLDTSLSRALSHRKYFHKSILMPWIRTGCWVPLEHFHAEVMDFMSVTSPFFFTVECLLTFGAS